MVRVTRRGNFRFVSGLLRKDLAMGLLIPLGFQKATDYIQCGTGYVFPLCGYFLIILRELGWKRLLQSTVIMVSLSLLVGGL